MKVPNRKFQSAPPVKGATGLEYFWDMNKKFQSAPPVKGATTRQGPQGSRQAVSIRAPREGGDGT